MPLGRLTSAVIALDVVSLSNALYISVPSLPGIPSSRLSFILESVVWYSWAYIWFNLVKYSFTQAIPVPSAKISPAVVSRGIALSFMPPFTDIILKANICDSAYRVLPIRIFELALPLFISTPE